MLSLTLVSFLALASQAFIVDVIPLDPQSASSDAFAINASGHVVGWESINPAIYQTQAFHWDGSYYRRLVGLAPGLPPDESLAYGINSSDVVVGYSYNSFVVKELVRWSPSGWGPEGLGNMGAGPNYGCTGTAVNATGVITGQSDSGLAPPQAFRYRTLSGYERLLSLSGRSSASYGAAILDDDTVAGWSDQVGSTRQAVYWPPNSDIPVSIHNASLFSSSEATAMTPSGAILGRAIPSSGGNHRAFWWTSSSGMTDLGTPTPASSFYVTGANDSGWVVGYSLSSQAFLWHPQIGVWKNLNDLIPAGTGMTIAGARGLNESGMICGSGMVAGRLTSFRLRPVAGGLALGPMTPSLAGMTNQISAVGGTFNQTLRLVTGKQSGQTPVPGCPGLHMDIANAKPVTTATVDLFRRATFPVFVRSGLAGKSVLFQALEHATCRSSNVVLAQF